MPETNDELTRLLEKVPSPEEIRRRITENLRQGKLLRQLLRLAEQRKAVEEVSTCE
jgi:hypothetical protein